ncbi:MAG: BON domain-containing protein [Planctomycetota bacterium]|nr:BON domain-containing protein [Planctomycetota bacterium]
MIGKSSELGSGLSTSLSNRKHRSMQAGPLLHRIDTAIRKNPYLLNRRVFLESAHGKITLRGKVDSYYQKQMVQEILRGMDGIAEISNQLEVDEYAST